MHDVCNSGCDCSNARESKTAEKAYYGCSQPSIHEIDPSLEHLGQKILSIFRKINVVLGKNSSFLPW